MKQRNRHSDGTRIGDSKSVYTDEAGAYYLVESEEYHIGSAYDHVNTYYALEKGEAEYYEKVAIDRERREKGE